MTQSFDRAAEKTLFFAVFLTPLFFFTRAHDQFELPKLVLLTFLLAALLVFAPTRRGFPPLDGLSWSLIALFAFQALACLPPFSLSWSTSLMGDYENFAGLATDAMFLLWYFALLRVLTWERIEKCLLLFLLAGLLSSLYALAQHFGFDFIQWNPQTVVSGREFASLGNPNFLAAYLAMVLPFGFLLFRRAPVPLAPGAPASLAFLALAFSLFFLAGNGINLLFHAEPGAPLSLALLGTGLLLAALAFLRLLAGQPAWLSLAAPLLLALGLFTTASRGGFLAALASTGAFWWFSRADRTQAPSRPPLPGPRLALFLAAAAGLGLFFGAPFFGRLFDSILHAGDSLSVSRLHIWIPALRMVETHPLHGVGLDTFKIAFPFYSGIGFNEIDGMFVSSRTAHNELLQTAATIGLPGLAAYLAVLFFFTRDWRRARRAAPPFRRATLAALFACALAYQAQNLFSFGVAGINFLWFFCLAAVGHAAAPAARESRHPARHKAAALLLAAALSAFAAARLGADVGFGRGNAVNELLKRHNPNLDPDRLLYYSNYGIGEIERAAALCPLDVKYPLYLGLSYEERAKLDGAHEKDWLLRAQAFYWKSINMSPANAYYYNDLGRVDEALALYDPQAAGAAEQAYARAVFYAPASPYFRLSWSEALSGLGKKDQAREQMDKAFSLDPDFTGKLLAQTALGHYQDGRKALALGELGEVIRRLPDEGQAYYYRGLIELDAKDRAAARGDLEKAERLDPANTDAQRFLDEMEGKK